jgi:hypothetical protein
LTAKVEFLLPLHSAYTNSFSYSSIYIQCALFEKYRGINRYKDIGVNNKNNSKYLSRVCLPPGVQGERKEAVAKGRRWGWDGRGVGERGIHSPWRRG